MGIRCLKISHYKSARLSAEGCVVFFTPKGYEAAEPAHPSPKTLI